ncbi:hypothetical protein EAX61_04675 [Dokdonia sinensis]|uniref:Leucine-rich repeat domain-containing protein n=1 Tax=Dokdonia sinensis TaxID=2479847 RepID=A0A3M0GDC1_9FLAO|nr:hypothetical protein [Dokdonia sinensis]RMB62875.1 hypothetical protein EAX61_04675 [Dokdonia sinensis]
MRSSIFLITILLACFYSCSTDEDSQNMESTEQEMQEVVVDRTAIPDPVFEAYLVSINADDVVDGSVITEQLLLVDQIVVDDLGIEDLTGIENCPNLYNLWLQNNNVSSLNVSQNTKLQFLYADGNNLTSIDVSNLAVLEKLSLRNNNLSTINITNNPVIELLEVSDNEINAISVVDNPSLFRLDVTNNPLSCIEASEEQINNQNLNWTLDADDTVSLDCN